MITQSNSNKSFFLSDLFWLLIAVFVAVLSRGLFLFLTDFGIDGDEAIVGLMAKHISEGREIPTFYYGQHYMGSLEAILVALAFKTCGIFNFSLKLVPVCFSIILVPLMFYLGKTLFNSITGRFCAFLVACPPFMLLIWSTKARGGFIELIVLGGLALLILLNWLKKPSYIKTIFIGLVLGLAWWVNNQAIYFMLPTALWMFLYFYKSIFKLFLHVVFGCMSFLVGGLPFWLYNLQHDFITFQMFGTANTAGVKHNFEGLFSVALPIILGWKRGWTITELVPYCAEVCWGLVAIFIILLCCFRRSALLNLFRLKIDRDSPVELFLVFVMGVLSIYTLSSFGALTKEPRYLLPIYVGLFVLLAYVLATIEQCKRGLGKFLFSCILAFNVFSACCAGIPREPEVFEGDRVAHDHSEIITLLLEKDIDFIRTDYWIGYRLAFETREQVKFKTFDEPHNNRIPSYLAAIKDEKFIPLLLVPKQLPLVHQALATLGLNYKEEQASGYFLIYDISPSISDFKRLNQVQASLMTNVQNENSQNSLKYLMDGDITTRWGSSMPQFPQMQVIIELEKPVFLRGINYLLSQWKHDYPRALRIELEDPLGNRTVLVTPEIFNAVRYFGLDEYLFPFSTQVVKKIYFVEEASDPVFDWSIAEVELLE